MHAEEPRNGVRYELFLEEHDRTAFAGEDAGSAAARRPAAHYDNVISV